MTADTKPDIGIAMSQLVQTALAQDKLSGLSVILGVIAEAVDAQIAILWQVAPEPVDDTIFLLAEWFKKPPNRRGYYHAMSLSKTDTHTGHVIITGRSKTITANALKNSLNYYNINLEVKQFLTEFSINSFLSIPLTLLTGEKCALNLFRNSGEAFHLKDDCKKTAQQLTELLPSLYQALTDKVAYCLVDKVNKLLQQSNKLQNELIKTDGDVSVYHSVCKEIASVLQVHETMLYLTDNLNENQVFKLTTGIWPDPMKEDILYSYKACNNNGLTGWILHNKKTVRIFDLTSYEKFRDQYHILFPGLQWKTERLAMAQKTVREALKIPNANALPPLSFMGTPVMYAGKLLGVIRCSAAQNAPYYFSNEKENLLRLMADQIGQAWNSRLTRALINEENKTWHQLSNRITELNNFVLNEKNQPKITDVYKRVLDVLNDSIPNSKISAVRLIDQTETYLSFVATRGSFWNEGSTEEVWNKNNRTYPLAINDELPQSIGAWVVKNRMNKVAHKNDQIQDTNLYADIFDFYKAKSIIVAPIISENKVIGVLDMWATEKHFLYYAKTAAELLGIQLGLYISFLKAIDALKKQRESQTRTYEDFNHQLKSPITQLHNRSSNIIETHCLHDTNDKLNKQLQYLHGLSGKALRVSGALRLFANLAEGGKIIPRKILMTMENLTKLLIENAIDHESLLHSHSGMEFIVVKRDYKYASRFRLEADIDLLKLAVGNLLDNAGKYSFKKTKVLIEADITNSGEQIHIIVSNIGLPLTAENITTCKTRGWRSNDAKITTGEGSGIGLWIVDHIMKAHHGELTIVPTDKSGKTEVKLIFPLGK